MKRTILAVVVLFAAITSFGQKLPADQIIGTWQCPDYKIEIYKSGDTYSGKLLWSKDMFEADGKTSKKDRRNPDPKLKERLVQGLTHISALTFKDDEYVGGKLYSVQDGNTYSIKGKLNSINDLETRGYKGVPMLGKTFKWKRVQ
ncbi:DUF2147 domain-containing protein [Mucilaginibacter pallidiroseus]|uniref:DUF2147 domain-containing protein n=1 Tax=Mucilaginibacter pallidiroseus TaxID=2599295 RepID=A0A563U1M9_9SPHI|nr:DUF2147 domain-containing protein [Mucilaginibacter pallidiroseus]TWR24741.1 DUF2147 domain-containing protein [Mucilaginibacter pallidiroseus]